MLNFEITLQILLIQLMMRGKYSNYSKQILIQSFTTTFYYTANINNGIKLSKITMVVVHLFLSALNAI